MPVPGYRDTAPPPWEADAAVDLAEAADFLHQVHDAHPTLGPIGPRLAEVRAQVATTGTYVHTPTELAYGAKLAWRNASRCIGRLYWQSLVVRDRRHSTTADAIFADVVEHLRVAGDRERGIIRPVITIFAPAAPNHPYSRIWNDQLIRYAGYRRSDGSVVGDPRYATFAEAMCERGWKGKGEAFDVLPLAIETSAEGLQLFDLPESAVWEIPVLHPELSWFAELGLRWHAVPAISNMRLSIGGVNYPMAPFNGWYMGTEIGGRNLADTDRYNMLPLIGRRMGLDTTSERTLWRDRALIELNRAVLWSFDQAGARISDHHTESRHFLKHVAREERAGRQVPADWSWIVPPVSGGTTPVFHRYYTELDLRPNFYLDAEAAELARSGVAPARVDRSLLPAQSVRAVRPHRSGGSVMHHGSTHHHGPALHHGKSPVPYPRLPLRPACPPSVHS